MPNATEHSKLGEIVETFKAVCRMCHGGCGTIVHMVNGTIKKVGGDRENPPFAYVAANLVINAIETVGPDRAKVAERLKRTKNPTTIIGPVEFDEHGQNTVPLVSKYVSQDGQWVLWEDSEYASGKRTLPGHKFKKM